MNLTARLRSALFRTADALTVLAERTPAPGLPDAPPVSLEKTWATDAVAGPFAQQPPSASLCTRCNPWHDHSHDARDRTGDGRPWPGRSTRNPNGGDGRC